MGVSAGGSDEDLMTAIVGGKTFDERLAQLASAKQSLEDAYTNLGLGKGAKLAVEDAGAKHELAVKTLANAEAAAAEKVRKAHEGADWVTRSAKIIAETKAKELADLENALKAKYDKLISDAERSLEQAKVDFLVAEDAKKLANEARFEAEELRTGMQNSKIAYETERDRLRNLVSLIKASISTALKE